MTTFLTSPATKRHFWVGGAGTFLLLAGGMVMGGWLLRLPLWEYFAPSETAMVFQTALCFALAGLALLPSRNAGRQRQLRVAAGCIIAAIAVMALTNAAFSINLGNELAALHRWYPDNNPQPGRMAPNTAIAFLLGGMAFMLGAPDSKRNPLFHVLPAIIVTLGLLGLAASVLLLELTYRGYDVPRMAATTAICMIVLGLALMFEQTPPAVGKATRAAQMDAKIYAFLGTAIAMLAMIGFISYGSIKALVERAAWVEHTAEVRADFEALAALDSHGHDAGKEMLPLLTRLQRLTADNPAQQDRLAAIRQLIEANSREGVRRDELSANQERFAALATEFRAEESHLLAARRHASQESVTITAWVILAGNVITFIILFCAGWLLKRQNEQRDRLTAALQGSNASLEAANKELESFTYSVSHDLRAPLRAINGYAQMLEEDYREHLDAAGQRQIAQIRAYTNQMGALIDDLLGLSRLGRQALCRIQIDSNALLQEVLGTELNNWKGPPPEVRIAPLPPACADPLLLRQLWANLISNALKYSAKNAHPVIEIDGKTENGEVVFRVKDNGVGFDMAYYDKLFKVFQRLHRNDEFPGTGVGLAIAQRVAMRHGGRVWALGAPGQGAEFFFSLSETDPTASDDAPRAHGV